MIIFLAVYQVFSFGRDRDRLLSPGGPDIPDHSVEFRNVKPSNDLHFSSRRSGFLGRARSRPSPHPMLTRRTEQALLASLLRRSDRLFEVASAGSCLVVRRSRYPTGRWAPSSVLPKVAALRDDRTVRPAEELALSRMNVPGCTHQALSTAHAWMQVLIEKMPSGTMMCQRTLDLQTWESRDALPRRRLITPSAQLPPRALLRRRAV